MSNPKTVSVGSGVHPEVAHSNRRHAAAFFDTPEAKRPEPAAPAPKKTPLCVKCGKPFTTRTQYLEKLDKGEHFCSTGCAIVFASETATRAVK